MLVGQTLSAATATSSNSAPISYKTSNSSIFTVDPTTAAVTAVGSGTAQIIASVPETANFNAAQAAYDASAIASSVTISTWIGASNSLVTTVPSVAGIGLYRSTSSNCSLAGYASCPNGQFNQVSNAPVTDTAANLGRIGFDWLTFGTHSGGPAAVGNAPYPARTAAKLTTASALLSGLVNSNKLKVVAGIYDLESGAVTYLT